MTFVNLMIYTQIIKMDDQRIEPAETGRVC